MRRAVARNFRSKFQQKILAGNLAARLGSRLRPPAERTEAP